MTSAIAFSKYIDITSSVVGSPAAAQRELIGRVFSTSDLLPPGSILEFTTANLSAIGAYFGTNSEEYLRAVAYASFISKGVPNTPQKISFARWVNVDVAPRIYGKGTIDTLSQFNAITTGAISLTLGSHTNILTALDFSAAASLADVATVLQDAIQAETGSGAQWTGATVTYNAAGTGSFNLVGGSAVAGPVSTAVAGSGVEIRNLIGWGSAAIFAPGALTETITETLTNSAALSNNFGSFLFTYVAALDLAQYVEAATWNSTQNPNVQYMLLTPVAIANAATWQASLRTIGGNGVTAIDPALPTQFPEQLPMAIMAATNYNAINAVQNYMFQVSGLLTPLVTDTTTANTLDALNINYYGNTQNAGQNISFYQRGFLNGGPNDPVNMGVYANEIWFKDAQGVALINLLLAVTQVPATDAGRAQVFTTLQAGIDLALFNGMINIDQPLTQLQILTITNNTGDPNAWYQVQNAGYWLDVQPQAFVGLSGNTEYQIVYTLVYTKNNVINKVVGSQLLI